MGKWNTHGMDKDRVIVWESAIDLGLFPEECMALADYADKEVWMCQQMGKNEKGQKKRRWTLIAGFWMRRSRRWKELAAELERDMTEIEEESQISS